MKIDRTKIDWSLSDAENARKINCHPATITRLRHASGIFPVNPHHPRPKREKKKWTDWGSVDWTKSNEEIANLLGLKPGTVAAKRSIKAKGSSGGAGRPRHDSPEWLSMQNKLSERKTVHKWLNEAGIPRAENGKPLCLLRRIRITVDRLTGSDCTAPLPPPNC